MMIHISKDEAPSLLNAVQDAMTTARDNLEECYCDQDYSGYCEAFFKAYKLEGKIKEWLKEETNNVRT